MSTGRLAPTWSATGVVVGVGALGGFAVLMLGRPLPSTVGAPLAYGFTALTALVAAALVARRARRAAGQVATARRLVSLALLCGGLGSALSCGLQIATGHPPPVPSVVDAVTLGFLPLCVIGLLCYPVSEVDAGSAARSLLDGAMASTALWFVTYTLLLEPAGVGRGLDAVGAVTVLTYPVAEVFLIGMAASVLRRVAGTARRELSIIAAGLCVFALGGICYTALDAADRYRPDSWVSVVWVLGLLLIVIGAALPEQDPLPVGDLRPPRRWSRWVVVLPFVPVVAAIGLGVEIVVAGRLVSRAQFTIGLIVLIILVLRQAVGNRDRSAITDRLRVSEELFRSLVTGSSDLTTLHDIDGRMLYASPAVGRSTGWRQDELIGSAMKDLIHPDDVAQVSAVGQRIWHTPGERADYVCRVRSVSGEWRWCQTVMHNMLDDPSVGGVVCNTRDVHEQQMLKEELSHAAHHDALTGLGNLALARAALARSCERATGMPATVVLVDLDGFKAVNDTFGHAHGDALLVGVADRLRACVRAGDEVTRIGGDEFVLVLSGAQTGSSAADRVLDALREPVVVAGMPFIIEASLGVATTADARTPDELLRNADLAMYAAKAAGRNRAAWYEPGMHESAAHRMQIHRGLRRALKHGYLSLHYQPIVALAGGAVVGAEALLRWDDPQHGPVAPDVFIPIAEDSGMMTVIDTWVLDRACADIARWRDAGLDVPPVSVNISRRHLTPELPGLVADTLRRHGVPGRLLCVEVTESAVVPDPETATAALHRLRELGVSIALDDFGTGESSLSQLARLPVDTVKIDKSFVVSSSVDSQALRLLTSIVGVCRALGLPMIAEGIEDGGVVSYLASIGCEYGQGYHFGRPQPASEFTRRLAAAGDRQPA